MPGNNASITLRIWVFVSCCCPNSVPFLFLNIYSQYIRYWGPNPQKGPISNSLVHACAQNPQDDRQRGQAAGGHSTSLNCDKRWYGRYGTHELLIPKPGMRIATSSMQHGPLRYLPCGPALGNSGLQETSPCDLKWATAYQRKAGYYPSPDGAPSSLGAVQAGQGMRPGVVRGYLMKTSNGMRCSQKMCQNIHYRMFMIVEKLKTQVPVQWGVGRLWCILQQFKK